MSNDCLPELTSEQFSSLLEDIRERGVQTAVEIELPICSWRRSPGSRFAGVHGLVSAW